MGAAVLAAGLTRNKSGYRPVTPFSQAHTKRSLKITCELFVDSVRSTHPRFRVGIYDAPFDTSVMPRALNRTHPDNGRNRDWKATITIF